MPGIKDAKSYRWSRSMRAILAIMIAASLGCLVTGVTLAQIGAEEPALLALQETIRQ